MNRHQSMSHSLPRLLFKFVPAVLTLALLGGCAIKPMPLSENDRLGNLQHARISIFQHQETLNSSVTLDEAMARAIKYNLDYRVKILEEALAVKQLDLANFDLLPKLTASAGYASRNNDSASSSESYTTHQESLESSISQDATHRSADLGVAWNILDFGVSYYQGQQQADRMLIMKERRRKVVQMLMQLVRQAYWQGVGAQKMEVQIEPLLKQVKIALDNSNKIVKEHLQAPLDTLNYQKQLLDIMRQLEAIRDELAQAKPRLASLMNLEPGKPFTLVVPTDLSLPKLTLAPEKMEETALLNRPELVEAQYNERIGVNESRKALARLLPGLEFNLGGHYDSNSFMVNNHWADVGLRVSWNLMNVLNAKDIQANAAAQLEVAKQQYLALNMAILAQVHVAYRDFKGRQRQYELSQQLNDIEAKILEHTRNAAKNNTVGQLQEIRASASAMMSELRLYQNYGALQSAYGQMQATLGVDPLPEALNGHDLTTLKQAFIQAESAAR
ncbi:MAG: TolC family protein [Pseudomonadota bacterium]